MADPSVWGTVGLAAGAAGTALGWVLNSAIRTYFQRRERALADRLAARSAAYGDIWTLTGALNLFGPEARPNLADFSRRMSDWYFARGQSLTPNARDHYFLIQEALTVCRLYRIRLARPDDETLCQDPNGRPPVKVLDSLRKALFERLRAARASAGPAPAPSTDTQFVKLRRVVDDWKAEVSREDAPRRDGTDAWIVLQYLLSTFRSRLGEEIGSRRAGGLWT